MAIIKNESYDCGCQLGIWKITEDYNTLRARLKLTREELDTLERFTHMPRKIEWLSVRVLLNEISGNELSICYNGNRKPFIKGNSYYISISHSRDLTSILLSREKKVGIDLEYMSHRIGNISDRFINSQETITDDEELRKYHLYIHWCAKEALYKICDKQDINFRDNLTIEGFQPEEEGWLNGWVKNKSRNDLFRLNYFNLGNYVVVWTCK
ncbi:MAG TPA: 4'-phosphopantetheinyl transferase superfamily protein [Bacteroidales bacterium]|jgi:4'-phosphopantetheinyl transferase EntD|nr:4'-phosphopantetheinyl transferase superfamily protein [Bacteroidales bacterium]